MKHSMPQNYYSRLWRAISEFDLIAAGDKILVGLSGGKDSVFLTYALALVRQNSPRPFELAAVNLDPKFAADFDPAPLAAFCADLGVPFHTLEADIAGAIARGGGKDPCYVCSFFRRAIINKFAVQNGFNKIAYAHHHDDAVETFVMGLLWTGQLKTFQPKTHLDRTGLDVIRPLVYFREKEIRAARKLHGFTPLPSPCPLDGKTKRQEIKEMIRSWEKTNKHVFRHLAVAMREGAATELWPAAPTRAELQRRHQAFWCQEAAEKAPADD